MKQAYLIVAIILVASLAVAFTLDAVIIQQSVQPWSGSFTGKFQAQPNESVFFGLDGKKYSACESTAIIYTSDSNAAIVDFNITNLDETGADLKFAVVVDGQTGLFDINANQSSYSIPFTSVGARSCLLGIVKSKGLIRVTTTDLVVSKAA